VLKSTQVTCQLFSRGHLCADSDSHPQQDRANITPAVKRPQLDAMTTAAIPSALSGAAASTAPVRAVAYKGGVSAAQNVIGGHLAASISTIGTFLPSIR
jgi:tripartite-type tricarboxylate transporter receptor subunit TctC